jgi:hypothetical protein
MRPLSILFVFAIGLFITACGSDASSNVQQPLAEVVTGLPSNATLTNIQSKIENAANESFFGYDGAPLKELRQEITEVKGPEYGRLVAYWTAYTDFQTSIFKLKTNDAAGSEAAARRGVAALEAIEGKNAEELALQSFIESFTIQFTEGVESARSANAATANIEEAFALNPENLRVQYVMGSMDYYTPSEYGGGTKAVGYLNKAIELPEQAVNNSFLPSWGKAGAYELLVRHYSDAADQATAKRYLEEGLAQYPNDYLLTAMAEN